MHQVWVEQEKVSLTKGGGIMEGFLEEWFLEPEPSLKLWVFLKRGQFLKGIIGQGTLSQEEKNHFFTPREFQFEKKTKEWTLSLMDYTVF